MRAVAERAEEGQAGGPALVGVAQVDDPVVGGVVAGAADVPGLLEAVDDDADAAGARAEPLQAARCPVSCRRRPASAAVSASTARA